MKTTVVIKLNNINIKNEKKTDIIKDFSFSIKTGEKVAIFQKNKAPIDKKILPNLLIGKTEHSFGCMRLNGIIKSLSNIDDFFNLRMSGRKNIFNNELSLDIDKSNIEAMEEEIIDFAETGMAIDNPVKIYSSIMKKKLAFAIGLHIPCNILVVDHTFILNDGSFIEKCRDRIEMFAQNGGTFLLFDGSHEMAEKWCDRGVIIKNGNLIIDDRIEKVLKLVNKI